MNFSTLKAIGAATALLVAMAPYPAVAQSNSPAVSANHADTRFVEVDGTRIAYRTIGTGEPIVLLQRFRASMDDWDPAFIDAVAASRRVIIFDNSGVGESAGVVQPTLEGASDFTAAFVRSLGLEKADILGWSMGGMTAQILAAKHPEVVRKLVLIGTLPPGGSDRVIASPPHWSSIAGKPTYTDQDLLFLFFSPSTRGASAGEASLRRTSFRRPAADIKTNDAALGTQYSAIQKFFADDDHWFSRLRTIKAPTLVANGDKDGAFPAVNSVILAEEIPNAQLAIYPDSGHGFHFQYPERFAADLLAFLSE